MRVKRTLTVLALTATTSGCASHSAPKAGGSTPPRITASGTPTASTSSAAKRCPAAPALLVWSKTPNAPATAKIIPGVEPGDCVNMIAYLTQVEPQGAGYCIQFSLASDFPKYNVQARPAPQPNRYISLAGDGCVYPSNYPHPPITPSSSH